MSAEPETSPGTQPAVRTPPAVAPYFPPPTYPPPPVARGVETDRRAVASVIAAIGGLLFVFLGLPGLVLGPVAYFLGKSAVGRIDGSQGSVGGRGVAKAGWVLGIAATALGALVTLIILVIFLIAVSQPTS